MLSVGKVSDLFTIFINFFEENWLHRELYTQQLALGEASPPFHSPVGSSIPSSWPI
jgi:hypothetical protein